MLWPVDSSPGMAVVTCQNNSHWALVRLAQEAFGSAEAFSQAANRASDDLFAMTPFEKKSQNPAATGKIRSLFLHITDVCNLRCAHCYYPTRTGQKLGADEIERMADQLLPEGLEQVAISGGEPLTHPELPDIIRRLKGLGLKLSVLTNATRIDAEFATLAAKHDVTVLASVHGPEARYHDVLAGSGGFVSALNGIRLLRECLPAKKLVINSTLTNENVSLTRQTVDLAEKLGAGRVRFMPLHGMQQGSKLRVSLSYDGTPLVEWAKEAARAVVGQQWPIPVSIGFTGLPGATCDEFTNENLPCDIGSRLVITSDGEVYPCALLIHPEFRLGSINDDLADVAHSSVLSELRQRVTDRKRTIRECRSCGLKGLCAGGCPALAWQSTGSFETPDPTCKAHKEYAREYFNQLCVAMAERD